MQALRRIVERASRTSPYQSWQRYASNNGNLLAAGVGYFAFFSIFPALALAFSVFGFVLRGRPDLLETIAESINEMLPGMVKTSSTPNGIVGLTAPQATTLTITGIVAFVTLLWAGLGWIGALRKGIRAIYGLTGVKVNPVFAKVRDLIVLSTLGLGIATSALLTSTIGGIAGTIADWIGLKGQGWIVTLAGLAVSVFFDTCLLAVMLRVLSGVRLPWREVRNGAILGALALTVLKYFGGTLVAHTTSNPLLGAVAVAVGLLVWLNLMSRVVLLSAAWVANGADRGRLARGEPPLVESEAPVEASSDGSSGRTQLSGPGLPSTAAVGSGGSVRPLDPAPGRAAEQGPPGSSRAQDRVSLALGAVAGAAGALLWSATRERQDLRRRRR